MKGCIQNFVSIVALFGLAIEGIDSLQADTKEIRKVGEWPGYTRGFAHAVFVTNGLAYVALGSGGFMILDVSNPASPVQAGRVDTAGSARGAHVSGNLAYVADNDGGLQILDVSNPTTPVRVGNFDTRGLASDVQVVASLAYVVGDPYLQILDVSNPATPRHVGIFEIDNAGSVRVVGNFAYVTEFNTGLHILDVSNPATPVKVGSFNTFSGQVYGVEIVDNLAYVANSAEGLQILNVSNPATPVLVGSFDTSGQVFGVEIVGNLAYVADFRSGLQVLDVSNPASPRQVGSFNTRGEAWGVQVVGNLAYVTDYVTGVHILDVSNPNSPVFVGGANDDAGIAWSVQLLGTLAYVADYDAGLQILDVSNPATPVRVGSFDTSGLAFSVEVVGSLAYVADHDAGLQILSVSNPATPVRVGSFDTKGEAYDVQVKGNLAYVADGRSGLHILDLSNPASPRRMSSFDTKGEAYGVQVVGNLAYVADGRSGLQILDVSDATSPVLMGSFDTDGFAFDAQVTGNLAYVADSFAGLQILDVSNAASPLRVGSFPVRGAVRSVQVIGMFACVAVDTSVRGLRAEVQLLDISNAASPVRVGSVETSGETYGVRVVGNVIYLAAGSAGLQVLEVDPGPSVHAPFEWARRIASTTNKDLEFAIGMTVDQQGSAYVTGWFDGTNNFGSVTLTNSSGGGQDIFVAKYDPAGALQWVRQAGGNSNEQDAGRGIGVDNAGNIYVTGGFVGNARFGGINLSGSIDHQFFLAKYDSAGTIQWSKGSSGGAGVYGTGLAVDGASNCYAVGYSDNGAAVTIGSTSLPSLSTTGYSTFLVKYDPSGAPKWTQLIGGPGETYASKVAVDSAGNVYLRGGFSRNITIGTRNLVSSGVKDSFVAKFDSAGTLLWVQQSGAAGSEGDDGGVAIDGVGNIYVSSRFDRGPVNFGGGISLTSKGAWDALLAKYNNAGQIQWARRAGGTGLDIYFDVALDAQGNAYSAGVLSSDASEPDGSGGAMIAKYDPQGTLQWAYSANSTPADPVGSVAAKVAVDASGNCYIAGWYQGTVTFGTNILKPQGSWNYFLAKISKGGQTLPERPVITAQRIGSELSLLWPMTMDAFRLESVSSLSQPISWKPANFGLQTNDGIIRAVVPMTDTQEFYRLKRP